MKSFSHCLKTLFIREPRGPNRATQRLYVLPGALGLREPSPASDAVHQLRRRFLDVHHEAALQPPGPVHAHRQGEAGERACHAGS